MLTVLVLGALVAFGWWLWNGYAFTTSICKVCSTAYPTGRSHTCWGRPSHSAVKDRKDRRRNLYAGVILDGRGAVVWTCPSRHRARHESVTCATTHLRRHQLGECDCTHICSPALSPASGGFRASDTATVYVVHHPKLGAVMVGVSGGDGTKRLESHALHGWSTKEAWRGIDPDVAFAVEQRVIAQWRHRGLAPAIRASQMPQGGATETVSHHSVTVAEAVAQVRQALTDVPGGARLPRVVLTRDEIRSLLRGYPNRVAFLRVADPPALGR